MTFIRRPAREWLQCLVILVVPLLTPLVLGWHEAAEPVEGRREFNAALHRQIMRRKAEVLLIGNSMLNTRMDKKSLAGPGLPRFGYVAEGGSRSVAWYFMLKNFAAAADPPPRVAVLFFRDYEFNRPGTHLDANYLPLIRGYMRPEDEPVLRWAQRLQPDSGPRFLSAWLPERLPPLVRRRLSNAALDVAAVGLPKGGDDEVRTATNDMFDFRYLRPEVQDAGVMDNDAAQFAGVEFTAHPSQTLLPSFDTVARSRGVRLVFYRIKRRPGTDGVTPQTPELRTYMADFARWAADRGHVVVDETDDPRLILSMYHDGDHLAESARTEWTQYFVERLRPWITPAPSP